MDPSCSSFVPPQNLPSVNKLSPFLYFPTLSLPLTHSHSLTLSSFSLSSKQHSILTAIHSLTTRL